MKKTAKKADGFTLVELIVVIAILAVLAGVVIPVYSGYIKKANEANDLLSLDTVKTAAIFTYTQRRAMNGGEMGAVSTITVDGEADTCTVTARLGNGTTDTVELTTDSGFLDGLNQSGSFSFMFKSGATAATWTRESGKWIFSQ